MGARIAAAALGIWLMAAPAVLGYGGAAATNDRIAGPIAATVAIVGMSGVMRAMRRVNTAIGAWIALAPLVLGYGGAAAINAVAVGVLLVALSFVRGRVDDTFGGGWSSLWS